MVPAAWHNRRRLGTRQKGVGLLIAAFVIGVALRILLLVTTIGTTDSMHVAMWAFTVAKHGPAASYQLSPLINHPPLSLSIMAASWDLAEAMSLQAFQTFRGFQVAADICTALLLLLLGRRMAQGRTLTMLFLLTPAVIFISGFHCNSDPTMIALLVAAVLCMVSGLPAWSGVFLALSVNIKIVPLLLVPLFAMGAGPSLLRFGLAFGGVLAAGILPSLVVAGPVMLRNIFLYAGYPGEWGIPAALLLTARTFPEAARSIIPVAKFYSDHGKWFAAAAIVGACLAAWWPARSITRQQLASGVPLLLMMLLFLAPGFGLQYLLWPLPLLPLLVSRRAYLVVAGVVSAYLFYSYTVWSGGFPWWFSDARQHFPGTRTYIVFGLITWLSLGVTAAVALPRFIRDDVARHLD